MKHALILLGGMLAGCGPGIADFTETIGETQYALTRTDSRSYWIYPREGCNPHCPSISLNVEKVRFNESAIAVRRQVVNTYQCDGDHTASQWLNLYEQYVIILGSNDLMGPMNVAEYQAYAANNPTLLADIDLLDKTELFDGGGEPLSDLGHCANAKPL